MARDAATPSVTWVRMVVSETVVHAGIGIVVLGVQRPVDSNPPSRADIGT